jgi:signal transduction histidine kinase
LLDVISVYLILSAFQFVRTQVNRMARFRKLGQSSQSSQLNSQFGKLPLQFALITPFVIQIFAAVGLIGYLSFRNGQQAVDDLADQLTQRVNSLVEQHLDSYLAAPVRIAEATTDAIDSNLLEATDLKAIQRFLWHQARTSNVTYINYGLKSGDYVGAGRMDDKASNTVSESSARTKGENYNYATDTQGNPTKLLKIFDDYQHQQESWYSETIQTKRPLWSQVYIWDDSEGVVSIAASRPVYNAQRQLVGAVSVDLTLSHISQFLQGLQVSPHASILIMERNGDLIASSGAEPVVQAGETGQRLNLLESQDPMMRAMAQQLQQIGLREFQSAQQLMFEFENERQFVHVTPWRDELGLDWLVVVRLPEGDFVGQIHHSARITLWLCLAALLMAILSGVWTACRITQPIDKLNRASQAIASGDLEQTVAGSGIREFNLLSHSFNQMAQQIKSSFLALEESNLVLEDRVKERTVELTTAMQDLQRTQAQLVQTEKMSSLGQLVAGVAHEINNPVNFIHGNLAYASQYIQDLLDLVALYEQHYPEPKPEIQAISEAIELSFLRQDAIKLHESMRVGTERIREIVLSLRNFSRLDEAEFKQVDLHEGIDSTLLILENRLKAKPNVSAIQVVKTYGQLPEVECYAGQLNQVFMNLLTNAIDALEELRCKQADTVAAIQISTQQVNDWVELRFSDNGPGMTAAVEARLFDPFFTTKPIGQGTGLGLSISYQVIVEKHGGQLSCNSEWGQGSEFLIKLPIRQQS